jgi:hypothetical protein
MFRTLLAKLFWTAGPVSGGLVCARAGLRTRVLGGAGLKEC